MHPKSALFRGGGLATFQNPKCTLQTALLQTVGSGEVEGKGVLA